MRRILLVAAVLSGSATSSLLSAPQEILPPSAVPLPEEPEQPVRERTIYIPYQRLRSLFEKEGRGVFVPYETFRQLWDAARRAEQPVGDQPMQRRSLIASIDSRATVVGDVVVVRSELQIELLDKGWHEIPLQLQGTSLRSATIDDQPARVFQADDGSRHLLLRNPDGNAVNVVLTLEYASAYQQSPGTNQVAFHPPQAPIHRWRIDVPQRGAEIRVTPEVAVRAIDLHATDPTDSADPADDAVTDSLDDPVSEEPGDEATASDEDTATDDDTASDEAAASDTPEVTAVEAFVGGTDVVGFTWTAKAEGAAGLAALVTAQTRQEVTVDEGVIRTRVTVEYDISRADISRLTLEVPGDHDIVNIFDPNVQRWEKQTIDGVQNVDVTLFQPTRGAQSLVVELEQFTGGREMMEAMVQAELHAANVKAVAAGTLDDLVPVGRQQGIVVVKLASSLRGDVIARAGLVQIDAAQLPAPLDRQAWDFAYRYASVPYDLGLRVEKLLPEISTQEMIELQVAPESLTATNTVALDVMRAGIFQIELEMPKGDTVVEVIGTSVPGGEPAAVDSFELKPAGPDSPSATLVVQFSRQALGRIGLKVTTRRTLTDPNLLTPTGNESELSLTFPRVATRSTLRSRGRLIVSAPGSLRLDPRRSVGVRPSIQDSDPFELSRTVALGPEMTDVATLSFGRDAVDLAYGVQRRRPYVTARQFLSVGVESGVAKFESTFRFDILYSGLERIRLDVPADLADELNNQDDGLRERPLDPQPDDVPEGYVAWGLTGDAELLGSHEVTFEWELPLGELPVGQPVAIELPVFKVPAADRFWGQVVGRKAETIEIGVTAETSGVRPIDPQNDLMEGFDGAGVARAYEFQGDWSLAFEATRYELEQVKRTSIERALVRMIVTRSDQVDPAELARIDHRLARWGRPLAHARHEPVALTPLGGGDPRAPSALAGQAVVLASGLGNPQGFTRTARDLGWQVREHVRFPDHHHYTGVEAADLAALAARHDATLVVTAKDAVKLVAFRLVAEVLTVAAGLDPDGVLLLDRLLAERCPRPQR